MEKILVVNMTDKNVQEIPYSYGNFHFYGRGLALKLIEQFVPMGIERFDEKNAIVLVPGLFAGCQAPSACRLIVATCKGKGAGIQVCNTTGDLPQKLGSLGIAGVVIVGQSELTDAVIRISESGVEILQKGELSGKRTSEMVRILKEAYGSDCALIGAGKSADYQMSLATFFCTYPNGEPLFHCPRNGFGDIFGAKNLRAIVVECKDYFARECKDKEVFRTIGKRLASRIVNDEVCGSALPAYGSITILKILKDKNSIESLSDRERKAYPTGDRDKKKKKINFCCAPMCVVGCLNRHSAYGDEKYSSPAQSEVRAALENCFQIDDFELAKEIQDKASEIGIVGTEFVTAVKVYVEAEKTEIKREDFFGFLDEIEKGSLVGRVIASRTHGIAELYREKDELRPFLDRKAIMDEALFDVRMKRPYSGLSDLSDMQLLYAQIFVLENLGFCIFTSFALLDRKDTFEDMAKMFTAKTGEEMDGETLIRQADACIRKEQEYEISNWNSCLETNIPPFTKVLYRYFGQR